MPTVTRARSVRFELARTRNRRHILEKSISVNRQGQPFALSLGRNQESMGVPVVVLCRVYPVLLAHGILVTQCSEVFILTEIGASEKVGAIQSKFSVCYP